MFEKAKNRNEVTAVLRRGAAVKTLMGLAEPEGQWQICSVQRVFLSISVAKWYVAGATAGSVLGLEPFLSHVNVFCFFLSAVLWYVTARFPLRWDGNLAVRPISLSTLWVSPPADHGYKSIWQQQKCLAVVFTIRPNLSFLMWLNHNLLGTFALNE